MSLEALEYALEHHGGVRAVVAMPSFQNPLGACMSEAAKRRLLKIVQRHGIALIEDDVFGDLGSAAERPPAVKAWDRDGRVIYCGSCSKSMAPGFRLGWVLGGRHQRQLESLKIGSSLAAPLLEQQVLADYMKSGRLPAHLRRLRTQLAQAAASARAARAAFSPGHAGAGSRRRLVAVAGTARAGRHPGAAARCGVTRHRLHARRPVLGRGQARSLPAPERRAALVHRDGGRAGAAGPGRAAGGDPKPGRPARRA